MSERRERKITMGDDDVCVVCFKDITIRCIMDCEHSICFECSTRLRVLCDKLECPICRQETTIAVFTREKGSFRSVYMRALYTEDKYKLALEDEGVRRAFSLLQAHTCTKCQPPRPFPVFKQLADHMLRQHQLQYCELCVKHLRIFTSERKLYTREKLALHKRKGDPDDSSHRGHPLCEYCQQRYNDKDELFLHLRRDHFHCHLCDADGKQIFYDDYAHLADHFREDHFFCEQGACKDEKFVVFRSDIDLQAHRASVHSEGKSRSQQRQDRTLTLEFSTEPAGRRRRNDGRYDRNDRGYERNDRGYDRNADRREPAGPPEPPPSPPPLMAPSIPVNTSSQQEFPTLSVGGATGGADLPASRGSLAQRVATAAGKTVRATAHKGAGRPWDNRPVSVNDEEFPTLGGGRAAPPPPLPAAAAASAPAFSVNVNKRGGKHGKNTASRQPTAAGNTASAAAASARSTEDFPSLAPPPPRPVSAPVITRPAPPRATHAAAAAAGASLNLTAQKKQKKPESAAKAAVKAGTAAGRAASVAIDFKKRPASASVAAAIAAAAAAEYDFEHELEEEDVPRISQVSNTSNIRIQRPEPAPAARPAGKGSRPPPIASDDAFPTLGKSSKAGGGSSWVTKKAEPAPKPTPKPAAAPPLPTGSDFPTLNPVSAHGNFGSFAGPRGGSSSGGSAWGGGKKGKKGKKGGGGGGGENGNASASAAAAVAAAEAAAGALNGLSLSARASDGTFQYQEPDNFTARNGRLVQLARDLCDTEEQFEAFKSLSKAFRESETSAELYYSSCLTLLGNDRFGKIFQELLVLLPNIARQQELLAAHEKLNRNGFTRNKFPSCPTCGQVLVFDDLAMHTSQHFEDGDFPVLG